MRACSIHLFCFTGLAIDIAIVYLSDASALIDWLPRHDHLPSPTSPVVLVVYGRRGSLAPSTSYFLGVVV